ncbi:hypothetical protein J1N35_013839 [Gossypium stocksii]|uniref:Reverse transcriptase domain-containing protein n=1 Tax=Gossypium stocksii TaxID=47602 RepID=A0A9D4A727_9ROSI|nr:hypothetical protein J1N35_013839 [Gossypium stocksii]
MGYVRSVRYLIKCNNTLSDVIFPNRGLRQGDPLSSYLFFFSMEAFSGMLIHAQSSNLLRGIRASMNGPRINHLFFADDALLFVSNKKSDVERIINILRNFATVSRQEINFEKLMALFSPKTLSAQRRNFGDLLGMNVVEKLDKYLGLRFPIVLSSKYFHNGNICNAKKIDKAFFTWSSIAATVEALKNGFSSTLMKVVLEIFGLGMKDVGTLIKFTSCTGKIGVTGFVVYSSGMRFYWKTIWKLDSLLKIRVFSWCVGHRLFPTNVKIASIRNGFDQGCPSYEVVADTLIHALKYYPISRENNRNNFVFKGKEGKAQIIWERASNLSKDFCIYNILNEPLLSQNEAIKKREKPLKGIVKINFDASINVNRMGYGMIIRDDYGFMLGGGGDFIDKRVSVHEAECIAFEKALRWRVSSILMATCFLKLTMLVL